MSDIPDGAMENLRPMIRAWIAGLSDEWRARLEPATIMVRVDTNGDRCTAFVTALLDEGPFDFMELDGGTVGLHVVDGEAVYVDPSL